MSISPFDSSSSQAASSSGRSPSEETSATGPISLSQSLIITAGMAGLIGLFSGVIIRFSLASSPNARFLSPLQTFPALSNWSTEAASTSDGSASGESANTYSRERDYSGASDDPLSPEQPIQTPIQTFEPAESPEFFEDELSEPTAESLVPGGDIDSADATSFDSFADRAASGDRDGSSRWEVFEAGPKFEQDTYPERFDSDSNYSENTELSPETLPFSEGSEILESSDANQSNDDGYDNDEYYDDSTVYSEDEYYDEYEGEYYENP